ncbi:hypothetical protein D0U04_17860 [Bacillus clarus]|uniref:DUF7668 domain-containing protein n=1 Tax=Bacillus clarus TaxID=2338372 RepID=A0A090Z2Q7_9BACI|nr:hypothetical protein [Bacillus clarus]KFM98695.1 hypothetical protein DJ93_4591 [Bacillus clarus]RFT65627.1 hypothetical protein D0U04_17860 [Bacillus clarus]
MNQNETKEIIITSLKPIIQNLVDDNLSILSSNSQIESELTEQDIIEEINLYPGTMTLPPDNAYHNWDKTIHLFEKDKPIKVENLTLTDHLDFDLFFDNKLSDLTLQCNIYEDNHSNLSIKIENIHVL